MSLTVHPFQPPLDTNSKWSVLAQNCSKNILYRYYIIDNEKPSQTPKNTTPPSEIFILNSYRTVP